MNGQTTAQLIEEAIQRERLIEITMRKAGIACGFHATFTHPTSDGMEAFLLLFAGSKRPGTEETRMAIGLYRCELDVAIKIGLLQ